LIKVLSSAFDVEGAIIDGFRLTLLNDSRVTLDTIRARWTDPATTKFILQKYTAPRGTIKGEERPNDYLILFGDAGFGHLPNLHIKG